MSEPTPVRTIRKSRDRPRCRWVAKADADYVRYHDKEWGRPVHDDRRLFEMLTLEGAQRGCPGSPSCASVTATGMPSPTSIRRRSPASTPAAGLPCCVMPASSATA